MKREYDFSKGRRGRVVPSAPGKTRVVIQLDSRILDYFRKCVNTAGGGNYQTLINEALQEHIRRNSGKSADGMARVSRRVRRESMVVNGEFAATDCEQADVESSATNGRSLSKRR